MLHIVPMSATKAAKVNSPIPAELDARLDRIAAATGLKKALLIRAALERQLPDIEKNGITFPPLIQRDKPEASAAVAAHAHAGGSDQ